jgi:hypothetical protein
VQEGYCRRRNREKEDVRTNQGLKTSITLMYSSVLDPTARTEPTLINMRAGSMRAGPKKIICTPSQRYRKQVDKGEFQTDQSVIFGTAHSLLTPRTENPVISLVVAQDL